MSNKGLFLISSATASFLTPFIAISVNVALPAITKTFSIDMASVNWFVNVFLISMASTILPLGVIADWLGRELIFITGTATFAITAFSVLYVSDFTLLLILRGIQGLGAAMISGTAVAILAGLFPEKVGFAIGLNTAAVYVGTTLGPALGGLLVDYAGWTSLFALTGAIASISALMAFFALDPAKRCGGRKPYFQTLFAFAFSTILIAFGSTYISYIHGLTSLFIGLAAFMLTIYVEDRRSLNFVKEIFRRSTFLAYITALLNYVATFALTIIFSNYLQIEEGFKTRETGLILLAQPLPQMLLSPLAGYLADRLNPSLLVAAGMMLIALGIGVALIAYRLLILLIGSLILLGVGFALFASPNIAQIMRRTPKDAFALASSFLGLMRFLGQSLSTSILTASILIFKPFVVSMEVALIIYLVMAVIGGATAVVSAHNAEFKPQKKKLK